METRHKTFSTKKTADNKKKASRWKVFDFCWKAGRRRATRGRPLVGRYATDSLRYIQASKLKAGQKNIWQKA